jgi:hypothetical protein
MRSIVSSKVKIEGGGSCLSWFYSPLSRCSTRWSSSNCDTTEPNVRPDWRISGGDEPGAIDSGFGARTAQYLQVFLARGFANLRPCTKSVAGYSFMQPLHKYLGDSFSAQ